MKTNRIVQLVLLFTVVMASSTFASAVDPKCKAIKIVEWKRGSDVTYGTNAPEADAETSGPDDINEPRVLAIDSKGDVYVADPVNYRVLKFDAKGKMMLKIALQYPDRPTPPFWE